MNKDFHGQAFDGATMMKLALFKGYIREWLPVFLARPNNQVNIYDFFSGPGHDGAGNLGSPLIILNEVKQYCLQKGSPNKGFPVRMIFNDINAKHVQELKRYVQDNRCQHECCRFEFENLPFSQALDKYFKDMRCSSTANLVIMDQFGVSEVTPEVVSKILSCGRTDILFFISSSFIRRFIETPEIQGVIELDPSETRNVEHNAIHRHICKFYRSKITSSNAYVVPFSIKKGSNIYGVIFATMHPLGAEKFLQVCWSLDRTTGEANYNIDNDLAWRGKGVLWEEYRTVTKVKLFEESLIEFIKAHRPNNMQLHRFCLESGFCSLKAGESLRKLQQEGRIEAVDVGTKLVTRRGFYLTDKSIRVRIEVRPQ